MIRWMRRRGGIIWCSIARNPVKVAESLRLDALGDDLAGGHVHRGDDGDRAVADVLELAAGVPARPGGMPGCLRDLAWMPVFSSMLISTVPGRRVQVEAADLPGPQPEGGVVGAVEPAADLVRADLGLGQHPAHGGRARSPGRARAGDRRSMRATTAIPRRAGRRWRRPGPPAGRWGRESPAARSGADRTGPGSRAPRTGPARSARPPRCSRGRAAMCRVRRPRRGRQHDPGPQHQPLRAGARPRRSAPACGAAWSSA